jgi:hypothetical protein
MMLADVLAKSGEAAKSGPIGLAVILVLCIVSYFLFKSMSKHLKTVREEFPTDPAAPSASVEPDPEQGDAAADVPAQSVAEPPDE